MTSPVYSLYQFLDRLVELLHNQSQFGSALPGIRAEFASVYSALTTTPPSIDDFISMLDSSFLARHALAHKGSWIVQRLLEGRPCCVNQKILLPGQDLKSPLVEQMTLKGLSRGPSRIGETVQRWRRECPRVQQSVDALLVRSDSQSVSLVKVCSLSRVKQYSRHLRFAERQRTLFGCENDQKVIENVNVPREVIGSLLLARDVITSATFGAAIRLFVVIVDDAPGCWNFQCHDVTGATVADLKTKAVNLDQFTSIKSTRSVASSQANLIDYFSGVPSARRITNLHQGLKDVVPVDRSTRCLMMLSTLFDRQRIASESKELEVMSFRDLTNIVEDEYDVYYPKDQRRHDVEDCLWRGDFIGRVTRTRNEYAIKPKGMVRMMLLRPRYNPMVPAFSAANVLSEIDLLSEIWRPEGGPGFAVT